MTDSAPGRAKELTRREKDVLRFTTQGLSPAFIGRELHISPDAVRAHLRRAGRKLGATTRDQAAQLYAASKTGEHQ
jgi:DNA-binding CsgD family transcriptional regulator